MIKIKSIFAFSKRKNFKFIFMFKWKISISKIFLAVLLLLPLSECFAQKITIKGTVKDNSGNLVSEATIYEKGTNNGALTDSTGNFSIDASAGATLVISHIGYADKEENVNNRNFTEIVLTEKNESLGDVVVVGYGTSRKKDLTGSTSTISGDQLEKLPPVRVDQMLQGRASGVDVKSTNGAPGSPTTIRIRGSRSINATNEPIYVIDGIIDPSGTNLNSINPADIESINVLKDASTTAIYGSRASNGVILITTKKGKAGKDVFRFSTNQGFSQLPKKLDMMNAREFAEFINEARVYGQKDPLYPNVDSLINVIGEGTNWTDAVMRTAKFSSFDGSVSGGVGGERGYNYFLSGNILDQEGIILNTGLKRYQGRLNLTKKFSSKFSVGLNINISREKYNLSSLNFGTNTGWSTSYVFIPPTMPIYNSAGQYESYNPIWYNGGHINNPVAVAQKIINYRKATNTLANFYVEYNIIKDLTLKSTLGTNFIAQRTNYYSPTDMPQNIANNRLFGTASSDIYNTYSLINENTLNYSLKRGVHNFDFLVGTSYQTRQIDRLYGSGSNLTNDITQFNNLGLTEQQLRGLASGWDENSIISFLGRVNYNFDRRYYITLTGRRDGASNFSSGKKWGFFPSGAFKWRISEEKFFENGEIKNIFSDLALRVSYGISGNQGIANYQSLASLTSNTNAYIFGGQMALGYTQGNLLNDKLSWETTSQLDAGLDIEFLKGRILFTADYYHMRSKDLLLTVQIASQTGYMSRLINLGKTFNQGFDFSLTGDIIKSNNFTWTSTLNISTNKQEVTDIGPLSKVFLDAGIGYGVTTSYLETGVPIGSNYGLIYAGTWKNQQEIDNELNLKPGERTMISHGRHYLPGGPRYIDQNNDGKLDINDYQFLGQANPKLFGGFGNTFTYKRVSLNLFLQFSQGNKMFNGMEFFAGTGTSFSNQLRYMINRWSPSNPTSDIPKVESRDNIANTRFLHDASFLRLKSAMINYNLGEVILKRYVKDINLFVSGTNLFLKTKYNGFDPEVNTSGGSSTIIANDNGNYPNSRTITLGLNITF